MLSIFSYVYWPSVCPLRRVSFKLDCLFFGCWVVWVLYKFWILTPYQMYQWICSPILWVVFYFVDDFLCRTKTFYFVWYSLIYLFFPFIFLAQGDISEKIYCYKKCPIPHFLDYCRFITDHNIEWYVSSNFFSKLIWLF